jgi:hypothetical protein
MSESEGHRNKEKSEGSAASQVLMWARCHPGMLVAGSLAVAAFLVRGSKAKPNLEPIRRPETEADVVDGETPLFV